MELLNCSSCDEHPVVKAGMAFCMNCLKEIPVEDWNKRNEKHTLKLVYKEKESGEHKVLDLIPMDMDKIKKLGNMPDVLGSLTITFEGGKTVKIPISYETAMELFEASKQGE